MAVKFNPFTAQLQLDQVGAGGGGSAFFAGEVAAYADLPLDGTAPLNSRWLVRSNSGTWPFSTYKQAGVYVRTGILGANRDDDYTLTDTSFHDVMSDDAFVLFDEGDATKNLKFQLSGITTGTTRTLTAPNASGTIALTSDITPGLSDGDKGDITVSATGATWTIDNGAVSYAKIQNVSATDKLLGRSSAGAGVVEEIACTSAGRALLDDADAAAQRTTLGLGTAATSATGDFAAASHTHAASDITSGSFGNISHDGKLGSTAGLPVVTTTAGAVTTLALGTAGQVLKVNSGATGVEFAADAGGISAIGASAADILSVSGSDLVADDPNADRIVFWDDSASKLTYLEAGSGLSISGTTLTATASGGSKTYAVFTAEHNQPPSTAFATLDTRNSIAVLDFDDATDESAVFVSIIPEGASLGSGLKIRLHWMATTATSGNVVWDVSLERMTTDLDSDSFDTIASGTAAANGTSGILTVTEITLTTIDSVTAGDGFRLKVTRDANNASDTMTGDAELVVCEVRSAA